MEEKIGEYSKNQDVVASFERIYLNHPPQSKFSLHHSNWSSWFCRYQQSNADVPKSAYDLFSAAKTLANIDGVLRNEEKQKYSDLKKYIDHSFESLSPNGLGSLSGFPGSQQKDSKHGILGSKGVSKKKKKPSESTEKKNRQKKESQFDINRDNFWAPLSHSEEKLIGGPVGGPIGEVQVVEPKYGRVQTKEIVLPELNTKCVSKITHVVRSQRKHLKYCYDKRLDENSSLRGTLVISMDILASGEGQNHSISDTLGDDLLRECVLRKIKKWRFTKDCTTKGTFTYFLSSLKNP